MTELAIVKPVATVAAAVWVLYAPFTMLFFIAPLAGICLTVLLFDWAF